MTDRAGYVVATTADPDTEFPWQIGTGREGGVGDILKALWAKEGAWGIWKGISIYSRGSNGMKY